MWCSQTLLAINQEAARLAREGKPERDALANVGITLVGAPRRPPESVPAEDPEPLFEEDRLAVR